MAIQEHGATRTSQYQNMALPEHGTTRTSQYQNMALPEHRNTRKWRYQNMALPEHRNTRKWRYQNMAMPGRMALRNPELHARNDDDSSPSKYTVLGLMYSIFVLAPHVIPILSFFVQHV